MGLDSRYVHVRKEETYWVAVLYGTGTAQRTLLGCSRINVLVTFMGLDSEDIHVSNEETQWFAVLYGSGTAQRTH